MGPNEGAWFPVRLRNAFCVTAALISKWMVVPIAGTVEVTTGLGAYETLKAWFLVAIWTSKILI